MSNDIEVKASNARPTSTGVEGAWDAYVEIIIDGTWHSGEVTLVRRKDGQPGWVAYGISPEMWVSGALLRAIYRAPIDLRDALDALDGLDGLDAIQAAAALVIASAVRRAS